MASAPKKNETTRAKRASDDDGDLKLALRTSKVKHGIYRRIDILSTRLGTARPGLAIKQLNFWRGDGRIKPRGQTRIAIASHKSHSTMAQCHGMMVYGTTLTQGRVSPFWSRLRVAQNRTSPAPGSWTRPVGWVFLPLARPF